MTRRSLAHVRNPVLALPAADQLRALRPDAKAALERVLLDLRSDAAARAEHAWRRRKGPMAVSPTVAEALDREERCKGQERRLLTWWREHPRERLTRYSAAEVLQLTASSGGRALSNLAAAGYVRKRLDLRVDGPCGASCHPYELVEVAP